MSLTPMVVASGLMIVSGSAHAIVNAIVKSGRDKMASRAITDGSGALLMLPAILLVPLPTGAWGWLAASAFIHAIYLYALIRAYQVADFSAAYPVLRGTAPLLTAIATIGLLGEGGSFAEICGIALIGGSMFVLAFGRHITREALGWSLLTGATIACYTVIDAQGVRAAPSPQSYIAWLFVIMGSVVVTMFGIASRGAIFVMARTDWKPGAIAGLLSIVTYGLALFALSLGPTAPLAALRESGMLTALAIAIFVLGERVTVQRAIAVVAILGGVVAIIAG
jgi:drug/metabolite transporter (DMT)-like permease